MLNTFTRNCLIAIHKANKEITDNLAKIVGFEAAMDSTFNNFYSATVPTNQITYERNGFHEIFSTRSILEEIKDMILELKIRGSVRERANGLFELRTPALGSIYGRTKEEIELKLTQKLKEVKSKKARQLKNCSSPLFSDFYIENYLPYKKATLAPRSIENIEMWYKFLMNSGLDKPLNKFTTEEIEKFLYSIPQTRKRQVIRGVFNNIFNYAKRLGKIKTNPCDNVEKVKHTKENGRALSFSDQLEFFNTLYSSEKISDIERFYLTFVYLTGTRRKEALSIKQSDLDFENNTIHIPGTKTKNSDRTLPMYPLVKQLLQSMQIDSEQVFNLQYDYIKNTIRKVTKKYHLHELRHTFGTIGICVQKLDPKTIALYMGHADANMTLNIYTHPEQLDKASFYNGNLSEEEKNKILRNKYQQVLEKITVFIKSHTH